MLIQQQSIILNNIKKKNKRILVGADAHWYDQNSKTISKKIYLFLTFHIFDKRMVSKRQTLG